MASKLPKLLRKKVKNYNTEQFAHNIRKQCQDNDGEVEFWQRNLGDKAAKKIANALRLIFKANDAPVLKDLSLGHNKIGDAGLAEIAAAFKDLQQVRETLERLDFCHNDEITTLEPLAEAGVFKKLTHFGAGYCSLASIPAELCGNLPMVRELAVDTNRGGPLFLSKYSIFSLPENCLIYKRETVVNLENLLVVDIDRWYATTKQLQEEAGLDCAGRLTKSALKK